MRQERVMRRWALGWVLFVCGCAEAAFSAHARDNSVEDIRHALAASRAPAAGPKNGRPLCFAVTAGPVAERQIAAFDLSAGKLLWNERAQVTSRVVVGRGLIAHRQGEAELVARDALSGRVRFTLRLNAGEKFVGAAFDDERLYYVVQATVEGHRASFVVGVDASGRELWRTPAVGTMGAPAARGGVVAVPNAYQNLSLLDGPTGRELARVRNTEEQITFVRALPSGFFFGGQKGVYLLDEKSASGTQKGSSFAAAKLNSSEVRTYYYFDGYQPAQAEYTAFDRNRLHWRAEPRAGGVAFSDDTAFLHNYRYFFAFDAQTGRLRWAYAHPRVDLVAAEAAGPTLVWASIDGDVGALDARTGAVLQVGKTGLRLAGATFDVEGYTGGAVSSTPDLLATLEKIVWDPDARFNAVKLLAVDALGAAPGKEASAALLKIVRKEGNVPPAAQARAGERLVERKDATALPLYLEALGAHYDYLEDRRPRGVEVLARVVAALGAHEAAPLLVAHLGDHETPQPVLKELVTALGAVAPTGPDGKQEGKEVIAALRDLLFTYRADPAFLPDPSPLLLAGELVLKMGGPEERRAVAYVAEEARTLPALSTHLKKLLAEAAPKK
jgi:outer membrane protein assembly factor BamB